ncbi:MAG: HAMP domain-containing histidine kinase [Candidatus Sericytochromatia bacterium]|nr:HAMP domain-containing histidine kinase [Candidatus Sericytochromatia bacterium]
MPQRKVYRPAVAILFGVSTISIFLILATMWNVLLVYDAQRTELHTGGITATGHWIVLIIGYVLFVLTALGIVYLFVLLLQQIKTNQYQQNFIDAVSHELRSPLTSIKLHLETLQRRALPEDKRAEFVTLMLSDVGRLSRLIEQVLEAARRDQPQPSTQMGAVALRPLVQQVASDLTHQHRLPVGWLTVEGADLAVWSRSVELRLVLHNLLDNAIKYSDAPVHVAVSWRNDGKMVEILVSDQGIGIPRAIQRRVFQRFFRGNDEASSSRKGTGLGLYIVKETVKNLRGRVTVSSPGEGQGSTFSVKLPQAAGMTSVDAHG